MNIAIHRAFLCDSLWLIVIICIEWFSKRVGIGLDRRATSAERHLPTFALAVDVEAVYRFSHRCWYTRVFSFDCDAEFWPKALTRHGYTCAMPWHVVPAMDGEENAVVAINPMGLPLKELRRLKAAPFRIPWWIYVWCAWHDNPPAGPVSGRRGPTCETGWTAWIQDPKTNHFVGLPWLF